MNEILRNIGPLFEQMDVRLKGFKKNTYEEFFNSYREEHSDFFGELNKMLASEENAGAIEDFAQSVISYVDGQLEESPGKVKRENLQINYNMFMAVYFMPAIREGKQIKSVELVEKICKRWAQQFKGNNIKSADFADILVGFRSKLCYVTTAVCKSLNKPEDCYELQLLKDYRDNCLMKTAEGEALVYQYYNIAPTIVKRISKSKDADAKYHYIWEKYLKPCISYIENGEEEACTDTYISMVKDLQKQYVITECSKD